MFELQKKMAMSLSAADISKLKKTLQSLPEVSDADNVKELLLLLASSFAELKETSVSKEVYQSLQDANQLQTTANQKLEEKLKTAETQLQQVVSDLEAAAKEVEAEKQKAAQALQTQAVAHQQAMENALNDLRATSFRLGQDEIIVKADPKVVELARKHRARMKADGHLKSDDPGEFYNYTATQFMKIFYGHIN